MTATGAEAGSNLVPAGPIVSTPTESARSVSIVPSEQATALQATAERVGKSASRSRRPMVRAILAGVMAALAGGAAWLLLQHGVHTDAFPPFLAGTDATSITRYSGRWISAAAAVGLLAALLLLSALLDVMHWFTSPATKSSGAIERRDSV